MRWFPFFILWLVYCGSLIANSYDEKYLELQKENSPQKIETFLDEWRDKEPNNPDAWITSANYYFNGASQIHLSTTEPANNDFPLTDQKTGKTVGSISTSPDLELIKKAMGYLEEGIKRFPDRLDIWCGLAYIAQQSGNFDKEFSVLEDCVAYAKKHEETLRWLKGQPLPSPARIFIPVQLHSYVQYYMDKETDADDERFFKIARLASENYPNHNYAFNDLAAYYDYKHDYPKTREYLEKAHTIDPKDVLVLLNLADVCAKMNNIQEARIYYQNVIKLKPDSQDLETAKKALQDLATKQK